MNTREFSWRTFALWWLLVTALNGQSILDDPHCPSYPRTARNQLEAAIDLDASAEAYRKGAKPRATTAGLAKRNLIDELVFARLERDGVAPAPLTTDAEFLRRASLDLAGRLPQPEQVEQFLANTNPGKRSQLVDQLLASAAYVDRWTHFYADQFQVSSIYTQYIGLTGRNVFHRYLRDFVARDRPYRDLVFELITATGDTDRNPAGNFLARYYAPGNPIQDTWDGLTDVVSTKFLGYKTECVSCHRGRGYLDRINVFLTRRSREDFYRMSAFWSRLAWVNLFSDSVQSRVRFQFVDRESGFYDGTVNPANPGPRPARVGGPYSPTYLTDGTEPTTVNWRREFGEMVTSDRQFARASVNYLWAEIFRYGIVDPPNAWDLARVDPANPPPEPWALQNSNPELLEKLTDYFIANRYSIRSLLRLIADSTTYQFSSRYAGQWRPEYSRYFARYSPKRLSAEELYDAQIVVTQGESPLYVQGFPEPLYFAQQLPDPTEPLNDWRVLDWLNNLGRGDWFLRQEQREPSVLMSLFSLNAFQTVLLTHPSDFNVSVNRVLRTASENTTDEQAIRRIFLSTLTRPPSADELQIALASRRGPRADWLSDLQWALMQKQDFVFNY
ncbi:MAG: DUF1549 and DUF1553 domain-containing protein [Bryobacteraceae bacterium]|nr:DUF1549 and DUF1553 domain-containing protein [Bryobacteraceae bacterium]